MYHHRLIQRVTVCLASVLTLVIVGDRILAADKDVNEPPKPAGERAPAISLRPATQPATNQKLAVAIVQGRAVFGRFKHREALTKKFENLQKQAGAAQQGGDQQKMNDIQMQMQKMNMELRQSINDALEFVAQRDHYDVVIGEVMYKSSTTNLPDITDAVVEHLNATATAPASEPAEAAETKPAEEKEEKKE